MFRKIAWIMLVTGVLLLIYPKVEDYLYMKEQEKLLTEWSGIDFTDSMERQTASTAKIDSGRVQAASKNESFDGSIDGLLDIPSIDLKMAVLKGSTQENLKQSVATVFSDEEAGEGNYSIAGHRSYTYGKHFNRLAELKNDDYIHVTSNGIKYTYRIHDSFRVKPENVEVLNPPQEDERAEITLITCSPMKNPTHRLIVKGELVYQERIEK